MAASLERLAHNVSSRFDQGGDAPGTDAALEGEVDLYWRALARALLDGEDPTVQREHPVMARLVAQARRRGLDEDVARRVAAHVVTVELGWRLFHGFVTAALELDDDDALRRDLLAAAWAASP